MVPLAIVSMLILQYRVMITNLIDIHLTTMTIVMLTMRRKKTMAPSEQWQIDVNIIDMLKRCRQILPR
jgi:hypothetical protein